MYESTGGVESKYTFDEARSDIYNLLVLLETEGFTIDDIVRDVIPRGLFIVRYTSSELANLANIHRTAGAWSERWAKIVNAIHYITFYDKTVLYTGPYEPEKKVPKPIISSLATCNAIQDFFEGRLEAHSEGFPLESDTPEWVSSFATYLCALNEVVDFTRDLSDHTPPRRVIMD